MPFSAGKQVARDERLWSSRFARFVTGYGVTRLAKRLEIRTSAIYHWIRGATAPKPVHAAIIQRLARESGARLTFDQIYRHAHDLRDNGICGTSTLRREGAKK